MKNLKNYGVQAMNAEDIRETDGGFLGILISAAMVYIAMEALGNPTAHVNAFMEGYERGYNYNQ